MQMTIVRGPLVEEVHQSFAPWLSQVLWPPLLPPSLHMMQFDKIVELWDDADGCVNFDQHGSCDEFRTIGAELFSEGKKGP